MRLIVFHAYAHWDMFCYHFYSNTLLLVISLLIRMCLVIIFYFNALFLVNKSGSSVKISIFYVSNSDIIHRLFTSQTGANNNLRKVNTCLLIATSILESQFEYLKHRSTSEQQPPVDSGHKFGVPWVVVVWRFEYI
jgi:hypothetical protein